MEMETSQRPAKTTRTTGQKKEESRSWEDVCRERERERETVLTVVATTDTFPIHDSLPHEQVLLAGGTQSLNTLLLLLLFAP
jgi:hypothetical protein